LTAAADELVAARKAAPPIEEEEEALRVLVRGLSGPQQTTLKAGRERLKERAGRVELEFEAASPRFRPHAEVRLDGPALATAQAAAGQAAARDGVAEAMRTAGISTGAVRFVGFDPGPIEGVTVDAAAAAPGRRYLRVAPLDDWTLVLGLRVVPR
jgi:hypothetical protein